MTKCNRNDCDRAATHAPRVFVPAKGWALEMHKPLDVIVGIRLCREHAVGFGESLNVDPEFAEISEGIKQSIVAMGKVEPNFDRLFVKAVRLDSAEYHAFETMLAEKGRPN